MSPPTWTQIAAGDGLTVFTWSDTCRVHALCRDGAALLIDLGDGSCLDHLAEIGVERVEWVLFTHHHREQCQGARRLGPLGAQLAAPAAERAFFEQPSAFRRLDPRLEDPFSVYGASYLRPPVEAVAIDRAVAKMDTFTWRGHELTCFETRGDSPGSMSYLIDLEGRRLAFSGDVMLAGGRMHTWFDAEWDYGYGAGLRALHDSAGLLADCRPHRLLPAHGPAIADPVPLLRAYQARLRRLEALLVRGYDVLTFPAAGQDRVSQTSEVPHLWRISPHLYKLKGPDVFANFTLLLADSGRALVVDCGCVEFDFLQKTLDLAKSRLGLRAIDAVIVTHMHGDHFTEAAQLCAAWGAQLWTLDRIAPPCEQPERFDLSCPGSAYGLATPPRFDRLFHEGETIEWEGFDLTVDAMPGQTAYALCLHGIIDGRRVAFTGDNLFGDPRHPRHSGHEAVVARCDAVLEEGYLVAADYLTRLRPDLIVGGHSYVMENPAAIVGRFSRWALQMRAAFRAILAGADYRYAFDPYWVRADPYRLRLRPGASAEVKLHVRCFDDAPRRFRLAVHTPPGLHASPASFDLALGAGERTSRPLTINADSGIAAGVHVVAVDVTLGRRRLGEWFDLLVAIGA
jgi:glyoxylase-like metal-dependent hydrolase (beta-lactamase superfamily II)